MASGALQRRGLLKLLGASGLGLPLVGEARAQQQGEPTLFLEVDLRVQVDLMHVMVPPSIAKYPNRQVGSDGEQLTLFVAPGELKEYPNNVFLTSDSLELAPHLDTIAMLDTGGLPIGGVHGMEAGCGMRSPGRVMDGGASGLSPMWLNDGEHAAASEELYANVPTPASLHNFHQKQLTPELRNGYTFKGCSTPKESIYHFAAGLPEAELDRIKSKDEMLAAFSAAYAAATRAEVGSSVAIRDVPLPPYLRRGGVGEAALIARFAELGIGPTQLALSADEVAYWSEGVPPQKCDLGNTVVEDCGVDESTAVSGGWVRAQIWEQFAWASKLLRAGVVRSAAVEFSHGHLDGDGVRVESVQRCHAQQIARPLARFITQMKAAGLYDRTIIAVYLVDGSHKPSANSYSDEGKGTFILAGGRIKGGYYGDILIDSDLPNGAGHTYSFRPPDPATGALLPAVSVWNDASLRTPDAAVWRTVMKALAVPETAYVGRFSKLLDDAVPLDCMLRS